MDIRQHIKALNEKRININRQQQVFIDECLARHPGQGFNAEERRRIARMDAEIEEISDEITRYNAQETRADDDARLREAHASVFGTGSWEREEHAERDLIRRFALGDPSVGEPDPENMGRRVLRVPVRAMQRQRDLMRDGATYTEARALAWDTGSVASGVPTHMANTLYEYLEAETAMVRMPTTKINTADGAPMLFPDLAAHSIGTQVIAQGTALAGTDPTFARLQLDAYKYGQLVVVASEVLQDAAFDVGEFLARDMGRGLGRVVDTDLVVGTGSGEPHGVMTALSGGGAGSVTTGGSLINPSYETLVDTVYAVNDAYRNRGNAAWLFRDATAGVIRKIRADAGGTTGMPLWQPSVTAGMVGGQPDMLLGYPVFTDPNVASLASNARVASFGDWNAYYVRQVGDVLIERSDERYFDTDQVGLRAKWRVDGDLQDYSALVSIVRNV